MDQTTQLVEGALAPDFRLPSTTGEELGPSSYRGSKKVILAFYPRDATGG